MRRADGFTLVELLVVMLILGLLAAIAIPAFFDQRDKARDADAKAAARTAQNAAETVRTDNNGNYDGAGGATVANLRATEPTLNDAVLTVPAASPNGYTVRVDSETGNFFEITRNNDGTTELTCEDTGEAGCPPDGTWAD